MSHSLYIHIPFCTHRCAYCDFNTYAGQENSIPEYVQALCKEIEFVGRYSPEKITLQSIFFGGGTPSLLSPGQLKSILLTIKSNFQLAGDAEITLEANPGTTSEDKLKLYRSSGINRISLGVQSANKEELQMVERAHNFFDVIEAVSSARKAGFNNLNLDLIYGLPEQTIQTWQTTVRRILQLRPEHISAYALTLEYGTPFGRWSSRGLLPSVDPDLAADMYEWASDVLETAGYHQYEISNWARENHQCRHNLQYWRSLPYVGVGAGAHGYSNGYRYSNVLRIKTYIDRWKGNQENEGNKSKPISKQESLIAQQGTPEVLKMKLVFPLSPSTVNFHHQTLQDDMSEFMITGLRLTNEGVSLKNFHQRFGIELTQVYGKEMKELIRLGLLEDIKQTSEEVNSSEVLRLTPHGRLLGNQVFMRFV